MSGTLSCSVFLLCFAVMSLTSATISEEEERVCTLTNYRLYSYILGESCSVKCVNGEERIKCLHERECKLLNANITDQDILVSANIQNATMSVNCYHSEEFFTFTYDMKCDSNHFNVYYNNPKCRTDCYSGVQRSICYSDRCSQSNSNDENCTMHCDFAEQDDPPCFHEICHPETFKVINGQNCTRTCEKGYVYMTCSYRECEKKNFTYYDQNIKLNYACSEYCEKGERYYVCPGHPDWDVPRHFYPTGVWAALSDLPKRENTVIHVQLSHVRREIESTFWNYYDDE